MAKHESRDQPLYDLDTVGPVTVEQGVENSGFFVRSSPDAARSKGGRVIGQGINRTESWDKVHRAGNGAALLFGESPGFTVDGLYAEFTWDGIRPVDNTRDFMVRGCWLNNIRDDSIENDRVYDGSIEHNLFEDVHTIMSARPGSSAGPAGGHVLSFVGNIVKMGKHLEDRAKRTYQWSPSPNYSCGQFFKVSGDGNADVVMRGNVICADVVPNASRSVLRLIPSGWRMSADSGNNIFVWLGGSNIPGLDYEEIDGVMVPVDLLIPQGLFSVTDDPAVYEQARSKWISEVWNGETTQPVEPPAPAILDVLQVEIDKLSKDAGAQAAVANAIADLAVALQMRIGDTQATLEAMSDAIDEDRANDR